MSRFNGHFFGFPLYQNTSFGPLVNCPYSELNMFTAHIRRSVVSTNEIILELVL